MKTCFNPFLMEEQCNKIWKSQKFPQNSKKQTNWTVLKKIEIKKKCIYSCGAKKLLSAPYRKLFQLVSFLTSRCSCSPSQHVKLFSCSQKFKHTHHGHDSHGHDSQYWAFNDFFELLILEKVVVVVVQYCTTY